MMGYCVAPNCKSHSNKGARLFRFPKDRNRRAKWVQNCRRDKWQPTEHSQLCELHFEECQFEVRRADGRKLLRWNAIPTLFDVPNPPKSLSCVRKAPKESELPSIGNGTGTMDVVHAIKCEPEDLMENGEGDDSSIMATVAEVDIKTEGNEDTLMAEVKSEIPEADIEIKDEVLEPSEWCEDEDSCSSSSEKFTKCPHCDEKYPDYSQMEYHIASLHPGKKRHLCFKCNKSFRRRTDFISHSKSHQGCAICPMCMKDFSKSGNLQRHLAIVHKGMKLFPCAVCKMTFSGPSELQEHVFAHNRDERLYSCVMCGKMFNRHENMLRHMMTHSEDRPHICPECKKGFKHSGQLKTHMQTHSDNKPRPCFTCDICFQTFTKMYSLRRHKVFHTNETPYLCSECGKAFKQKSALDYHHKSLHSTERLHLCHQCGMSFVSQSTLNKHESVHHSGIEIEEPVGTVSSAADLVM